MIAATTSGQHLTLDTLSTGRSRGLTRLGFRAKLVQSIGDLEPRSFEVDEDGRCGRTPGSSSRVPAGTRMISRSTRGTGAPHTVQNARRYPGGLLRTGAS